MSSNKGSSQSTSSSKGSSGSAQSTNQTSSNTSKSSSNSQTAKDGWGSRTNFQASYGLNMSPDDIAEGNAILERFREEDSRK